MAVRFIFGPPGTGKTTRCLNEISTELNAGAANLYYLVPEQFSLQSEKLLTQTGKAHTRVQVLSFNRLAYQLFARLGGPAGKMVDELGKNMLLRKVLFECGESLLYYRRAVDKQGFIDDLSRTVTELNHYHITPEDLLLRADQSEPGLKAKLTDLALIVRTYREAVTGRYLLADDTLDLLCQKLEETAAPFAGGSFWVDGFTGFTPQERRVLGLIMQSAKITFALTLRSGSGDGVAVKGEAPEIGCEVRDSDLCRITFETWESLTALARACHVKVEKPIFLNTDYRHTNELFFWGKHFNGINPPYPTGGASVWKEATRDILLVSAPDRYAEVYEAARRVWGMVREGYRFREMAVLCGDRAGYEKILRNAFARSGIPLFVDTKTDILSHPLTELVRAAIDIAAKDWPYESVFRFVKTRLTGLPTDDADILENYVLANGIKGYFWNYPFSENEPTGGHESFLPETARQYLRQSLAPFLEKLYPEKKETVHSFCQRVFEMLYFLRVPDTLTEWHAERIKAGDHENARIHRQIWPKLCEIFDKLVEMLGDETVTLKEFARILDAGLMQADLGLIPPSVDQVFLGDVTRSRFPEIKVLMVLGANENKLPPPTESSGLFTDDERVLLRNTSLELAPDRTQRASESWFSLYCALCKPSERLIFLYSNAETSGIALRQSKMLQRLKEMFPAITEAHAIAEPQLAPYPEPHAFDHSSNPFIQAPQNRDLGIKAGDTARAGFVAACQDLGLRQLSPETTARLYGQTVVTAASHLEDFSQCPFAYFVTRTLKARERKIYQVHPTDLGVVFHEVLALFSKTVAEAGLDWGSLDKETTDRYVNTCVETVVPKTGHVLRSNHRNRNILRKVSRICRTSVWALSEHIKRGSFIPAGIELDFKPDTPVTTLEIHLNNERRLILTGRIDRVDILRTDNGVCYVKIIDYKSGRKRFDISEVLLGTQLQLILYMNAILKNGKELFGGHVEVEARPGGVFYFHIDDPVIASDAVLDDERREMLLLKCFRMSGLALAEPDALDGMDENLRENGGESLIIPVSLNKNGAFGKHSSVADADAFEQLGRVVEEKIKEIGLKMTEGVIEPDPYVKGRFSACDYCRYGAICGHR